MVNSVCYLSILVTEKWNLALCAESIFLARQTPTWQPIWKADSTGTGVIVEIGFDSLW